MEYQYRATTPKNAVLASQPGMRSLEVPKKVLSVIGAGEIEFTEGSAEQGASGEGPFPQQVEVDRPYFWEHLEPSDVAR
jgi:hypothetical protein